MREAKTLGLANSAINVYGWYLYCCVHGQPRLEIWVSTTYEEQSKILVFCKRIHFSISQSRLRLKDFWPMLPDLCSGE